MMSSGLNYGHGMGGGEKKNMAGGLRWSKVVVGSNCGLLAFYGTKRLINKQWHRAARAHQELPAFS